MVCFCWLSLSFISFVFFCWPCPHGAPPTCPGSRESHDSPQFCFTSCTKLSSGRLHPLESIVILQGTIMLIYRTLSNMNSRNICWISLNMALKEQWLVPDVRLTELPPLESLYPSSVILVAFAHAIFHINFIVWTSQQISLLFRIYPQVDRIYNKFVSSGKQEVKILVRRWHRLLQSGHNSLWVFQRVSQTRKFPKRSVFVI